jgi:hypothetical protein
MIARPYGREARVTTRGELDAALRAADRIVVEGDTDLIEYAARLAGIAPRETDSATLRPPAPPEREAHIARMSRAPRLWPWVAGAIAFAAAAGAALLLEHFSRPGRVTGAAPPVFQPATLAWPAIAVLVILALYIVARRSGPSDRSRAWQVSEKSARRVVITRVRARAV